MINAVVPVPGKSFEEAFDFKEVFATWIAPCSLGARRGCLPKSVRSKNCRQVEYVYICGEKDDAIRPECEQYVARKYLHVEPVVIKGAGHANIVLKYAGEVADASTKGLSRPRTL